MSILTKVNGVYNQVSNSYVKINGIYTPVLNSFVKVGGIYRMVSEDNTGDPVDPTDDLNSIDIVNTIVANGEARSELLNIWGTNANRDRNNYTIGAKWYYSGTNNKIACFSVALPKYTPVFNQDSNWFLDKDISIAGSTANIVKSLAINKTGVNDTYSLLSNNVINNIQIQLTNNSIVLYSNDRSLYKAGGLYIWKPTQSQLDSADVLNRRYDSQNKYGLLVKVQHIADSSTVRANYEWRIEVDVQYNITFVHNQTGQTRVLTKTIQFRTYN